MSGSQALPAPLLHVGEPLRCGGRRHAATAAGRAFCSPSLCYMTKAPLSPGFFPHRPGGYLKVPSQLFKGAQIPMHTYSDPQQRPGAGRLNARNAARQLAQIPTKLTQMLLKSGAKQQIVVSKQQFLLFGARSCWSLDLLQSTVRKSRNDHLEPG